MKGRKITLAQLRGAEEWFELSVINFHLLCRMGQCDVKFVFERDIQSFSNRWGWEQRWSHFIKEENVSSESQLRLCALSLEVMFGDRLFFLICSFADSDKNEGDKK